MPGANRYIRHLGQALRGVGEQYDAQHRCGPVECGVIEDEGLPRHDACLDGEEALGGPRPDAFNHA